MFGSALLRREGVRGFGFGNGCSGVIQMTQDGRRQVGIGRIGVGTVTVMTKVSFAIAHVNVIFGGGKHAYVRAVERTNTFTKKGEMRVVGDLL